MKRPLIIATVLMLLAQSFAFAQQSNQSSQQKPTAPAANQPQQQTTPPPTRAPSKRERSITGRVIDENNQPIEDAIIIALPAGLTNAAQSLETAAKIRPTSPDEQGKFSLENLTPGAYKVFASVPAYVAAPDADENPEQKYHLTGDTITLRMIKGGVVTGTVTTQSGEPMVGLRVRAVRVRDLKGRPATLSSLDAQQQDWKTDDRGIYRIYGLEPGVYMVSAGGKGLIPFATGAYDSDAPTYHPSSTRNTATEVTVHSGEELSGIDIRYRDSLAYAITGTVTSAGGSSTALAATTVVLTDATNNAFLGFSIAPMTAGSHRFAFDGVADGEYFVSAVTSDYKAGATSHRIAVKGADVTGIDLLMTPFSSIEGRVALEPAPRANRKDECQDVRAPLIEEVVILARQDAKQKDRAKSGTVASLLPFGIDSTPDNKGEFKLGLLEAARYRMETRLPSENWYIRSITLPAAGPGAALKDAGRDGLALKPGEHVKGMTITLAEGAARIRGRVMPAAQGARLPERLRVHLVPAEKESADDTLRFYEAAVEGDGTFSMSNLAPGRYLVVARPSDDKDTTEDEVRPLAWDASGQRTLRGEAESANVALELKQCQRIGDYALRYTAPVKKQTTEERR